MFRLSTRPCMICNVHQISSNSLLLTNYLFSLPSPCLYFCLCFLFLEDKPHTFTCSCFLYICCIWSMSTTPPSPCRQVYISNLKSYPPPSRSPCDQVFVVFISEVRVRLMIYCRLRLPSVRRPCTPEPARYR